MSSRPHPFAAAALLLAVTVSACVPADDLLEGRPCPCAEGSGFVCVGGVCVSGGGRDAGRDGAVDAATIQDAAIRDAAIRDAAIQDAGTAPPPVPTDCWARSTPCDWSDPLVFEFVLGPAETLAGLDLSSNPTFSPDGCALYYSEGGTMHVARRASAAAPFVGEGPIAGVDQASSGNSKATVTPDGRQLFFTSNRTDGTFHTIHRALRAAPEGPWGVVEEVTTLSFPGVNNWDGVLAPHGLRYYWAPARFDDQDLFVGERDALDEPFRAGVAIAELAGAAVQAEPAVTADGRVLVFITDEPAFGGGRQLAYATRSDWRGRFGEVREVPGAAFDEGEEADSTVSPDGCELITRKGADFLYLVHAPR